MANVFIDVTKIGADIKSSYLVDPEMSREFFEALRSFLRPVPSGFSIFYAVKCNPDIEILKTLNSSGCGFEVASVNEFNLVSSLPEVDPSSVPVTNPVLSQNDVNFLIQNNARIFVTDSLLALERIRTSCVTYKVPFNEVKILVRLSVSNQYAAWDLSDKFGVDFSDLHSILRFIKATGFSFHGFSFHVGSQAYSPQAYVDALKCGEKAVLFAREFGLSAKVMDIGGGFPINYYGDSIVSVTETTRSILENVTTFITQSPILARLQIWAEPGRFLAAPSGHVVTTVIAKIKRGGKNWVYTSVGTYNGPSEPRDFKDSFVFPVSFDGEKFSDSPMEPCVITGPTCDSSDIYSRETELPSRLSDNDILQYPLSGAYSNTLWSSFNGFNPPETLHLPGVLCSVYKK